MASPVNNFYEFDGFRVDTQKRLLLRDGAIVPLTPKAFDTLLALVGSGGEVVEKDELMKAVWPDTIVEESALSRNIYLLRRALGESPDEHRYIVTAPGRGYRFVAVVAEPSRGLVTPDSAGRTVDSIGGEAAEPGPWPTDLSVAARGRTTIVARPVAAALALLAIVGLGWRWWSGRHGSAPEPGIRTLAVLPFKPLVADARDDYLGLGMADALITRLGNLRHMVVRPTSAILQYTNADRDPRAIGTALKVDAVLDGTIQRDGDRVRVTARLLSAPEGRSIWSSQFEEKFTEMFAVEDRLSQKLTEALAVTLSGEEKQKLARRDTKSPEAFQAYLRGRYFCSRWNRESLEKAVASFGEALRADSEYAPALSGLADASVLLGYLGFLPPREAFPKSKEAALKALKLDDSLAEAHASLAKTRLFYEWDWAGAEREIKRALELNPNYADAHGLYGAYLLATGDFDRALIERKRALDLDPVSPFAVTSVGWVYFYAHRFDEAIDWYKKARELDPNFALVRGDLINALLEKGSDDEAIAEIIQSRAMSGATPESLAALEQKYAAEGIKGYWRSEQQAVEKQLAAGQAISAWRAARIYAALGDHDRAFELLDKAYDERTSLLTFIKTVPVFDVLHADPRFAALLRRMGL